MTDFVAAMEYIAEHSPGNAESMTTRIERRLERLLDFPLVGRAARSNSVDRAREVVIAPFIVRYVADESGILITSFRHGAQLPPGVEVPDEDEEG